MINFEQARPIVAANLLPTWDPIQGEFYVAQWGWESPEFWVLPTGAKEWLVDEDENFRIDNDALYLVNKKTGEYLETSAQENLEFLMSLEPYGDIPQNFQ